MFAPGRTSSHQGARGAIGAVLFSSVMWAFWWYPLRLIEASGASGAVSALFMCSAALVFALPLLWLRPGRLSSRGIAGTMAIGAAVMMYTIAVSYTDFIRAVLIFYVAPAWSLSIECIFLGRRWTGRALFSIACSFIGLLLISRGEISLEGVGALGDWMALVAGLCWSIGAALLFTAREAAFGPSLCLSIVGSVLIGGLLVSILGSNVGSFPSTDLLNGNLILACAIAGFYLATILACTLYGAILLPPTVLTFLLSVEIVAGVIVSATILGEHVGWIEVAGMSFVLGAVLVELTTAKAPS